LRRAGDISPMGKPVIRRGRELRTTSAPRSRRSGNARAQVAPFLPYFRPDRSDDVTGRRRKLSGGHSDRRSCIVYCRRSWTERCESPARLRPTAEAIPAAVPTKAPIWISLPGPRSHRFGTKPLLLGGQGNYRTRPVRMPGFRRLGRPDVATLPLLPTTSFLRCREDTQAAPTSSS
jgi:hypothetical protein